MKIPVFWHTESPTMMSSKPLLLRELNEYLVCKICCGYLIDATTITECLHSFCKSCIVKHLEESNFCPACDVQVHKAKPLMHIRPDRTLQDLVYKLVPELFRSEMARRKEFYSKHPEAGAVPEGSISSRMLFFAPKDQVSLSLEYIEPSTGEPEEPKEEKPSTESDVTEGGKKVLGKRYLCCPAAVTIGHLQKFIRLKYDLEYRYKVDIFSASDMLLPEYRLSDVAYITSWTQEQPLRLFYRIYQIKQTYNFGVVESPKTTVSKDSAQCQKNDQAILSGGECAKIGSDAPPIEQTLPSNVTNLEEARGVKRQMPVMPKAKAKAGVMTKKRRLDEISQSARLKLIAKAKSEKLNGHGEVPRDSSVSSREDSSGAMTKVHSASSRSDAGGFKPIASVQSKPIQRNGSSVVVAKPIPKAASEVQKPKVETVKIPKPESHKKDFKGDSDLRPLRPDTLSLPPISRIDPKSPTKSPTKTAQRPSQGKDPKFSDVGNASSCVDPELKPKSASNEPKDKSRDKTPDSTKVNETTKTVTDGSKQNESKSLVAIKSEQPKPISEAGKVLSGNPAPTEKPIPELREIDKKVFLEQVDLTQKKELESKPETVSETLLSEIRDRALSKKSLSKDLSVFVKERTQSASPPESISDIKEFISATSPENKMKQENSSEVKVDGEDPPSKRRKSTNGGPIRTMPNLIAISEIPTPLIARSMQTMAGSKKPEVKIIEAVKSSDGGKMSPKEGNGSPQTSTIILDLSGKSSRSTSRSSSVGTPDDRKSPSPPAKRASPPAVSITERVVAPKPSPSVPAAKSSPQPQNSPLPPLSGTTMFPFPNMNMQAQANLQRTAMSQNQILQSMAMAQRQQQLAMYAANAAKQAINATSPLTNRAEFERLRNMLTWNALAQFQNQRPAAPVPPESPRPSTSKTPDKTPSSMMMKLPNVTRPKAPITKPGHDPINVRIKHFIQSQQSARATSGQGPRANLNSSVREIPNPSLLQQRRLTQLLHAGASQDRVTITKAETPSPKEIVETKLAANKEITVSIVNPEDKKKSPDRKFD